MAAKQYVINAIKKGSTWKGSYGDMQDYALSLKGIGEPVKISLPMPILNDPEIGDHLYGRLFQEKGNNDRTFYRLKLEQRPESDVRQMDIHAQVAIKLAVDIWLNTDYASEQERIDAYGNIEPEAVHFAEMINSVREELQK